MQPGTQLGPYQITSQLGAGGMGEVYRATDTRLDRTVAIKILPEHLASDPSRRERFEREAKAVSSLNHPHICTLHDVGEQDGIHYLVMELVEGETLESTLAKGRLPLDKALEYAIQTADALDKAHRQGVVHRDLKPGNIMLTKSGVKLLDFGLAKLKGEAPPTSGLSQAPTQEKSLTAEGTIIGTLQYMAPEQLEGEEADARTDIFAFGAVVYEMVTGKKAFVGKSQASLIGAILKDEPKPVTEFQPVSPRSLDRALSRCLAKDPEDRWHSAGDLAYQLSGIQGAESVIQVEIPPRLSRERLAWVSFGAALILAAVMCGLWLFGPSGETTLEWFSILPPNSTSGVAPEPAVSPDGESIVFRARNAAGETTLWIRQFDSGTARELPGTEEAYLPFWSPDGRSVGFFAPQLQPILKRIDADGNSPPQDLVQIQNPRGADWNGNGVILLVPGPREGLHKILASGGGALEPVTTPDPGVVHWHPHFLADGNSFLFFERDTNEDRFALIQGTLDSDELIRVAELRSRATYADGYLFFGRSGALFAQRFDMETSALSGEAVRIADDLGLAFGDLSMGSFSVEGNVLALASGWVVPETQILAVDRLGRSLGPIGEPSEILGFTVSRDELTAAVEERDAATNTVNVSALNLQTGDRTRMTYSDWWGAFAVWSPDSRRFVFPDVNLFLQEVGSSARTQLLEGDKGPWDWSPDGNYLVLLQDGGLETQFDLSLYRMADGEEMPYANLPFKEMQAVVSPNSEWLAYVSDDDGEFAVYIDSFPQPSNKQRVGTGQHPMWRADGGEIYFLSPQNQLMVREVEFSGSDLIQAVVEPLFEAPEVVNEVRRQFAVLDDGERFIFNAVYEGAEPRSITVVRNWKSLLQD